VNIPAKIAFLKHAFNGANIAHDGVNIAVACPNQECLSSKEGKRKFSIHVGTDKSHCWVCGFKTKKNLLPALRKVCSREELREYMDKFLPDAASLKDAYDLEEIKDNEIVKIPDDFKLLASNMTSRDPIIKESITYLFKRGLYERDLWYYKFGVSQHSQFHRRVIMPSFDEDGNLNYFTARAIDDKTRLKYFNATADKIVNIFNEVNIDWSQPLTIVEGPFDLTKCDDNATCLLGSTLSEDYLLFWKIVQNKTPVLLGLDADVQKKTAKLVKLLQSYDVDVKIIDTGNFADIGEMTKEDFLVSKQNACALSDSDILRNKISSMSMKTKRT